MMENIFSSPAIFSFKYSQYSRIALGVGIGGVALICGCDAIKREGRNPKPSPGRNPAKVVVTCCTCVP